MRQLPQDTSALMSRRLHEVLPPRALDILRTVGRMAAEHGWRSYLVGGYVRDCLLRIPDYDIDVSLEGDALSLARELAPKVGARLEIHEGFGTAVLLFENERFDVDLVTARREWYERPGALPSVAAGTIQDDLARRDFTVNAMAAGVTPDGFGPFLDPHGGLPDLQRGLIRVLHPGSFLDDPTRIFRAIKLARRLDFQIEPGTLSLISHAVREGALATVSMDRITHELVLIMEEPTSGKILAELDRLGVLARIHPALSWRQDGQFRAPDENESQSSEERRDTCLAIIAAQSFGGPEQAEALARSLRLGAPQIRLMRDAARLAGIWPRLGEEALKPSETHSLLHGLDMVALEAYARIHDLAGDGVAWSRLHDYLERLRHVKTAINGHYLRAIGVPPGPVYKRLLQDLLDAKLNEELPGREDEEHFVKRWLEQHGYKPGPR